MTLEINQSPTSNGRMSFRALDPALCDEAEHAAQPQVRSALGSGRREGSGAVGAIQRATLQFITWRAAHSAVIRSDPMVCDLHRRCPFALVSLLTSISYGEEAEGGSDTVNGGGVVVFVVVGVASINDLTLRSF